MSNINKAAVLNPFTDLTSNILDYVPRATTSEFGIVAIGSGINVDALGRIYLDTQEYSDRLTAIEAQAASSLTTQQTEVAAAIAQVNLTQSQAITALSLEVSNLKTNLTDSITATQTELIDRADQLAQEVTDITVQLTQDKATFTQEIQDALDYLKDDASVASALRTPRKIQGVDFDGTQDISLPTFSTQTDGLVPKRVGATTTNYLREDGTWVVPTDTTYALLTKIAAEDGTATTANTISAQVLKEAIQYHAPTVTNIVGNAGTAAKLQTPRTINGVSFDGTQDISLPEAVAYSLPTASDSVLGGIKVGSGLAISNSVLSVGTLNQSTTGNAATATKLQTARTIGGVAFDGTANISLPGVNIQGNQNTSGVVLTRLNNGFSASDMSIDPEAAWNDSGRVTAKFTNSNNALAINVSGLHNERKVMIQSGHDTPIYAGATGELQLNPLGGTVTANGSKVITVSEGTAVSATRLQNPRTINGVAFDGTANVTIADSTKVPLTGGTMTGNLNANALGVNNTSEATGLGLSLYGGAYGGMPEYGLVFSGTAAFGTHGRVVGDWATYFTMCGATNRGWVFKSGNGVGGNVASISAYGEITGNSLMLNEVFGANYIANGNGDAASYSSYNMVIKSHWGIGFRDYQDVCRTVLDTRTGDLSTLGTITAASVVASGNITAFSDARLKDNITKIPDALNKLNQLKGVTYTRKDIMSDKKYAGLIAQDVQKVLPEAVAINEDEITSVDYNGVIGLLVEAIKELEAKVMHLEDK